MSVPGTPSAAGDQEEIRASLQRLRNRARVRARAGLLDDAVETMNGLGFNVVRLAARDDVITRVLGIIPSGATAVYHPCVVGRAIGVADVLRAEGRTVVTLPGDGEPDRQHGSWHDHLLAAQFGITGANALVADTGSLMLAEDLGFGRAASNVPPVHIALVTADSVVENLLDAVLIARGYAAMHLNRPVPRYVSLVSGPSKTADIGFTLVHGMHGPRTVHVLIWEHPKGVGMKDEALRAWVLA
jgi:LUD domain